MVSFVQWPQIHLFSSCNGMALATSLTPSPSSTSCSSLTPLSDCSGLLPRLRPPLLDFCPRLRLESPELCALSTLNCSTNCSSCSTRAARGTCMQGAQGCRQLKPPWSTACLALSTRIALKHCSTSIFNIYILQHLYWQACLLKNGHMQAKRDRGAVEGRDAGEDDARAGCKKECRLKFSQLCLRQRSRVESCLAHARTWLAAASSSCTMRASSSFWLSAALCSSC